MNPEESSLLGKGWHFPPSFGNNGATIQMAEGVENVHKSIQIILKTSLGERIMQEDFGAALQRYLFEPVNHRLLTDVKEVVSKAILLHEPRVVLNNVQIVIDKSEDGLLLIQLQYTIEANNTRFNMVYPFYLREAENQP